MSALNSSPDLRTFVPDFCALMLISAFQCVADNEGSVVRKATAVRNLSAVYGALAVNTISTFLHHADDQTEFCSLFSPPE